MKKINKIIFIMLFFIFGIGVVFAVDNYFKSGENWDANVSDTQPANDVFSLTGRLDLEDSRTSRYINDKYRGKITGNITSNLFGNFQLGYLISTPENRKIELYKKDGFGDYNYYNNDCMSTQKVEKYILSGAISSTHWGEMTIEPESYFCSNQYTYIVFNSNRLGNKEIGSGSTQTVTNDDFGKQEIAISGIANLKGEVDILERGDDKINQLGVSVSSKALVKQNVNKRVFELFKTYGSKKYLDENEKNTDFSTTNTNKENYYLYDYNGETTNIELDSNNYINEGEYLTIGTNGEDKISITGKHTVIVDGGNIYINSNLDNTNDTNSLLVLVAKRGDNNNGGNIYIDPDVTNIDAILIADGSLISMEGNTIQTVDESGNIDNLRKQLLIYGSVLTSNTVGSSTIPYGADYYDEGTYLNNTMEDGTGINTNIYDLGNLRTFNLNYGGNSPCSDTLSLVPIGIDTGGYKLNAWAGKKQCYNSDTKDSDLRGSTKLNPLIIEYNKRIPLINPYILQK